MFAKNFFSARYKEDNASELNESKVDCIVNINICNVKKYTFFKHGYVKRCILYKRLNRYYCDHVFCCFFGKLLAHKYRPDTFFFM